MQRPEPHGPETAFAIGLHVVGEGGVGQHRHVAEHIVEDVRLFQVIQLVGAADEAAGREAPVGQVIEEHLVGHQARHRDHAPAGERREPLVHLAEVGDAGAV